MYIKIIYKIKSNVTWLIYLKKYTSQIFVLAETWAREIGQTHKKGNRKGRLRWNLQWQWTGNVPSCIPNCHWFVLANAMGGFRARCQRSSLSALECYGQLQAQGQVSIVYVDFVRVMHRGDSWDEDRLCQQFIVGACISESRSTCIATSGASHSAFGVWAFRAAFST